MCSEYVCAHRLFPDWKLQFDETLRGNATAWVTLDFMEELFRAVGRVSKDPTLFIHDVLSCKPDLEKFVVTGFSLYIS